MKFKGSCRLMVIGALALLPTLSACDLTRVSAPDITTPTSVANAQGALTLRAGAMLYMSLGYAQAAEFSGVLTDELTAASAPDFNDMRSLAANGSNSSFSYSDISTARVSAIAAAQAMHTYSPTPPERVGELWALAAFAEVAMAEDMCAGVVLGRVTNGQVVRSSPLTRVQLLDTALAHFDSATAYANASDSIINLIRVGRGRALVDLGQLSAADIAVAAVPTAFSYALQFGGAVQQNTMAVDMANQVYAVSDVEGLNGLNFGTAQDPRVTVTDVGLGPDGVTEDYEYLPYGAPTAPITLASGVEARLIAAEADLAAGQVGQWAARLDTLRSTAITPGMSALTTDSTTTATSAMQFAVHFRERAFWLFLTGHRQGDLRRLIRQYGRTQDQVFPTGPYKNSGSSYGSTVTFPVTGESQNPTVTECIDGNA